MRKGWQCRNGENKKLKCSVRVIMSRGDSYKRRYGNIKGKREERDLRRSGLKVKIAGVLLEIVVYGGLQGCRFHVGVILQTCLAFLIHLCCYIIFTLVVVSNTALITTIVNRYFQIIQVSGQKSFFYFFFTRSRSLHHFIK